MKIYECDADGSGFRVMFDGVAQRESVEAVGFADPTSHGDTVDSMSKFLLGDSDEHLDSADALGHIEAEGVAHLLGREDAVGGSERVVIDGFAHGESGVDKSLMTQLFRLAHIKFSLYHDAKLTL